MALCNCKNCKRLYNHIRGVQLCNDCDIIILSKIKEYLNENRGASINEISEATEVSKSIIVDYVKGGILTEIGNIKRCQGCNDIIENDQVYCNTCMKKIKFRDGIKNLYNDENDKSREENHGMHFINTEQLRGKRR